MTKQQVHFFTMPKNPSLENADQIGFEVFSENSAVLALADGVGKSAKGAAAARIAIAAALMRVPTNSIPDIFNAAQLEITTAASKGTGKNWSTTLTLCLINKGKAIVGHVGDSRLYHLRGTGLVTRTRDQTEVQVLIDEGIISKDRARTYARRNVLVSALSSDIPFELYQEEFDVLKGDRLLLISDGVYKQLSRKDIAEVSLRNLDVVTFINQLKACLENKGLLDDSTALCWEVG
ncbi:MAG: protein phosphatase 2C domain-containing protein [Vitreoscilla sp.]|nr:protein phosphatase 2C domain-containing protein [Polaromonas sp.]